MLYFLYLFGRRLALSLSLAGSYRVAVFFADLYYLFAKNDKRNLESNLKAALGVEDKKLLRSYKRSIFRNFAKYLADFFRFGKIDAEFIMKNVEIRGKENIDKALSKGRGVVLLTAHLGNWELGGAIIASFGYPLYVIALDHKDARINRFFIEQRERVNMKVISIGAALRSCFRTLRNNGLLAILGDRDFSNHGITAEYFGRPTLLPRGPAFFHLRTGAPIIPVLMVRKPDDSHKIVFEPPIELDSEDRCGCPEKDAIKVIGKYCRRFEEFIRQYPGQWYAFRRIWE